MPYISTISYFDNDEGRVYIRCLGIYCNADNAIFRCEEEIEKIKSNMIHNGGCYDDDEFGYNIYPLEKSDEWVYYHH